MNMKNVLNNLNHVEKDFLNIVEMKINNEDDDIIMDSHELSPSQYKEFDMKDVMHIKLMFIAIRYIINNLNTINRDIFYNKLKEVFHAGKKNEMWSINILDLITNKIFKENLVDDCDTDSDIDEPGEPFELDNDIEEVYKNIEWRDHQKKALNAIGRVCGIIFHIMGAGKTFIMLKDIYNDYDKQKAKVNGKIYIITCPKQEILRELFFDKNGKVNSEKSKFLEQSNIINLNKFNVISKVHFKTQKLDIDKNKPTLLIINTDYLKSMRNNKKINFENVRKVYFDECHGVSADKFYELLKEIKYTYKVPIIGFSATPLRNKADNKVVDIFSKTFNKDDEKKLNVIDSYDMFSAIKDNIILPPYHVLCEVNKTVGNKIGKTNKDILKKIIADAIKNEHVPYKKFVGWCRNIAQMEEFYTYIKKEFPELKMYCTSYKDNQMSKFNTNYKKFLDEKGSAFLLCVNRVREGSDIRYLDTALYLDGVRKRSNLVSMQTMGRVLRPDDEKKKENGYVIDTYTNEINISIEAMTAEKIIEYYQSVYSLCDREDVNNNINKYNELEKFCKSIKYDEDKQEIILQTDNNNKHDIKFKICPITFTKKTYDFSKLKDHLRLITNKIAKIDTETQFKQIISKLKELKIFNINCHNFWKKYNEISQDIKDEHLLPTNLYDEYKEFFDKSTWYELLDLDTSHWYQTKSKCMEIINNLEPKKMITISIYKKLCEKDKLLPPNPKEFFKKTNFVAIEHEFNCVQKVDEMFI